jgi:hypothetical protein
MVVDDKEKKPQEQKVAEQESAPSALDIMTAQAMSLGAQAEEEQKVQDERIAQFAKNQEARQKAIAEGRSVYNAMFQKRKPEYDANKEKRLRNRAIVQSLGDILSAVASGAIAYGGRGQGYVPALPKDSALASLEDINKMRREYETANKEWEDLDLTYRLKAIEAEEEALKKMGIAEAEEVNQGAERVASKKKEAQQAYRDVLKTIHSEEQAEKQRQFTASENAKNRSTRTTRGGGNPQEIEDEVTLTFAELLNGGNIYGETERESTTTGPNAYGILTTSTTTTRAPKKYNDLSALEKRTLIQKYKADKEIQKLLRVYNAAKEEGVTDNDAIEMAWEAYNESKK